MAISSEKDSISSSFVPKSNPVGEFIDDISLKVQVQLYLTSKKRCRVSKWLGGVSSAVLSKPSLFTEFMSMPSSLSRAKRYPRALCVTMSWAVFPRLFRIAVLAPNTSKCFRASLRLISNRSLSRSEFELSSQWRTDSPWRNYTYENLNKNHGRWHKPIYTHHSQWYIVNCFIFTHTDGKSHKLWNDVLHKLTLQSW